MGGWCELDGIYGGFVQFLLKVGGRPGVLSLALMSVLMVVGCASSTSSNNVTATPTFSPGAGSYNASQTVTIADATSGAVLYCTTDGTTPTTSSPQCAQPTTVFKTEFLQAIAVAPGMSASPVASAGYTINLSAAATPAFSPAGGVYTSAQAVTITDATTGANIYYTVDGSTPKATSALYTGPVTVSRTQTLSAIAIASGFGNSGVASAAYTINPLTATPVFSVPSGTYTSTQTVTLTDPSPGASIFYTLDGSIPTSSSTPYTAPITVAKTQTINAIAVAPGLANSAIASAVYTINLAPAATPVFSVPAGTYTSAQTVTISSTTPGASIFYTLNGSTPTSSSTPYTGAITVSQTATLSAIVVASGFSSSAVATAAYTINTAATPVPVISPATGTFTSPQTVTITDAASGANIFYTLDGSAPSSSSTPYTGGFTLSETTTVNAIAIAGGSPSAVATATLTFVALDTPLRGSVFAGTSAVASAQVQMYVAGQTGYGSVATLMGAPATTATDGTGVFSLSFTCARPEDLVYLVSTGGNPGTGANSSLKLMAALGPCGSLDTNVKIVVNEISTVASVYALSAFITTAPDVGSSASNYQGLANAFKTVDNLVDLSTGRARTITPAYAASPVPFLNSSTVPQARIDTLANILNTCANTNGTGGGCSNLFSLAAGSGAPPVDTLQAILNIAQHPGTNSAALYALASPSAAPFQPMLAAAPGDWTLALTFTGAGLGIAPGTVYKNPDGSTGSILVNSSLIVDASGNLLVSASNLQSKGQMIAGFSNQGAPLTPATTLSADPTPVATYGGTNASLITAGVDGVGSLGLDPNGNLWGTNFVTQLVKMSPDFSTVKVIPTGFNGSSQGMTLDGSGNIWIGGFVRNYKFDNEGTQFPGDFTGIGSADPYGVLQVNQFVFDASGNLWAEDSFGDTYLISQDDGTILYDAFALAGTPTPLAADGAGNIYGCGSPNGPAELDVFNASPGIVKTFPINTGRGCGNQLLIDGLGHLFAVHNSGIDQFNTTNGILVSPSAKGYTGTSSDEVTMVSSPIGAALDGSGNLWVLNPNTGAVSSPNNVLVEFIGIGAPVVTPTSAALAGGQVGVRP
jgi:hypothetical protein